jgi:hypothetical protein
MKWMRAIQCGLLCAVVGGWIGFYIGVEYNRWYRVVDSDRGGGYLYFQVGDWGLAAGLVVGVMTALLTTGGFWRQLGISMGILVAVAWSSWAIAGWEAPPKLDGEELNLLVEVRSPEGWKPDNRLRAGQIRLTLETLSEADVPRSLRVRDADWPYRREEAGRTIVPGTIELYLANALRRVTQQLGGTAISFRPPLPARPGAEATSWSEWAPADAGFAYRVRVERVSETQARWVAARAARTAALRKRFDAVGPGAPLTAYLDFYRDDFEREFELTISGEATDVIRKRAEELGPLLASPEYSRYALSTAVAMQGLVPESYEGPLRRVLPLLVERIDRYRGGDPKDPDLVLAAETYTEFEQWVTLWKRLQAQRERPFPAELRAVREAARGIRDGSGLASVERRVGELLAEK